MNLERDDKDVPEAVFTDLWSRCHLSDTPNVQRLRFPATPVGGDVFVSEDRILPSDVHVHGKYKADTLPLRIFEEIKCIGSKRYTTRRAGMI